MAVISLKNTSDVTAAAESLRKHMATRRGLYAEYGPAEAGRFDKAEVFTSGRYAVFILANSGDNVKKAFTSFIEKA